MGTFLELVLGNHWQVKIHIKCRDTELHKSLCSDQLIWHLFMAAGKFVLFAAQVQWNFLMETRKGFWRQFVHNLSAHLCITPTFAPQITSHLLVISSFPNLARFPHPLASRTVWHFEVKLGPHLPTVINYMKEALLAEFPNQQTLLCHPRVLLSAQYTYTFCFSVGMTLRLMINPKSQR